MCPLRSYTNCPSIVQISPGHLQSFRCQRTCQIRNRFPSAHSLAGGCTSLIEPQVATRSKKLSRYRRCRQYLEQSSKLSNPSFLRRSGQTRDPIWEEVNQLEFRAPQEPLLGLSLMKVRDDQRALVKFCNSVTTWSLGRYGHTRRTFYHSIRTTRPEIACEDALPKGPEEQLSPQMLRHGSRQTSSAPVSTSSKNTGSDCRCRLSSRTTSSLWNLLMMAMFSRVTC